MVICVYPIFALILNLILVGIFSPVSSKCFLGEDMKKFGRELKAVFSLDRQDGFVDQLIKGRYDSSLLATSVVTSGRESVANVIRDRQHTRGH